MPATRELFEAAEKDMLAHARKQGTGAGEGTEGPPLSESSLGESSRLLSDGMQQMTATAKSAEAVVEAAGEITKFPRPTAVEDEGINWRSVFLKTLIVQAWTLG